MKKFTAIVLFIFVIQLLNGAATEMEIFSTPMHSIDGKVTIDQLNSTMNEQNTVDTLVPDGIVESLFAGAQMLIISLTLFLSAILNTLIIAPTLMNYGMPFALAAVFQGLTTLLQVFMVIEIRSGRKVT